ncbi:MAG: cupredoxin domain-containing protein [Acidobacteriia bacterium]|nr:cupredoxin domain-containing protein [Terriglobia bacterium]
MRSNYRRIVLASLVVLAVAALSPHRTRAQQPRVINITAKRFEFNPNQITLKKGEPVKLLLTSADVTHGFFLKPLKIDEIIEPGKTTEVNLTPQTAGTYLLICDHFCGVNHASMNMKVVVE